jgi:hypothetical protein
MKALFKTAIAAALTSFCCTLSAQVSTNVIFSTAKDAFVSLTAIVQTPDGGTNKVRVTNKDILAALNATGAFNFTNQPKLLMRSFNSGQPYFVVRDSGTNEVDVSEYLTVTAPDDAVHGQNSKVNWVMWNVTLTGNAGIDFAFWGLTTLHTGNIPTGGGGFLERTISLSSVGSGPGHINGANAQFSGTFMADHATID